ncbi:MAG TPA: alginate export family protein [Blastocatellia bacterium]|nr:alginate export family protein [Blastocatellia bacterium]
MKPVPTLFMFVLIAMAGGARAQTPAPARDQKPADTEAARPSAATQEPAARAVAARPAPVPTPPALKIGSVVFSGSLRLRLESIDWFETPAALGDSSYTFGAAVLRFGFSQQKEKLEWQVEGAAPVLFNLPQHSIAPAPQGQLGHGSSYFAASGRQDASLSLKQGFVRFKGLFGDAGSSLKLGRFEFNEGSELTPADPNLATIKRDHISQRLIGTFGFTHIGRSFDGLQYARNFKSGNLTFVGARPTEGVFKLNANRELDVDFYYGAFTKPFKLKRSESEARAFVLHYHDGRRTLKADNRTAALRTADLDHIRLTTVGGHYIGVYPVGQGQSEAGKVDLLLWGAGQFGDWGRLNHRAGAVAAEAGYAIGARFVSKIKPWVRAGYFRGTGDGDPTDGTHRTFFQVLPTPRIYARMPFFNLMNNEDAFGQIRLKPQAKVNLRFDAHYLRLTNSRDLWYVGGGAFEKGNFGYVGRPSNGRRNLGWLFDMSADINLSARTTFSAYFAGVRGGGVQSAIYPTGGPNPAARFVYFELVQKF